MFEIYKAFEGGETMASTLEIRDRHKHLLGVLLTIKKANEGREVTGLQKEIDDAVIVMEQEDVAWVEKIIGIKAI